MDHLLSFSPEASRAEDDPLGMGMDWEDGTGS